MKDFIKLKPITVKPVKPTMKGVYKLNPTRSVMKSNGSEAIKQHGRGVPGFRKVKPATPKMAIKGKKK